MSKEKYIDHLRGQVEYWKGEIERKSLTHQSACTERAFLHDAEQRLEKELFLENQIKNSGAVQ